MAIVLLVYYGLQLGGRRYRLQNLFLLVASYYFYSRFSVRFLGLILASTTVDFFVARELSQTEDKRRRWHLLLISLIFNLSVLGFFKYFNFFAENLHDFFGFLGLANAKASWTLKNIVLPVGISFYTFQTLSYTIDVYRGRLKPVRNFLDFALFVSFFPQLVAGPIERASNLLPQILEPRNPTLKKFQGGLFLILGGLFKKIFIADQIARIVDPIFLHSDSYLAGDVAIGALFFGIQIYADFSGYTDIARGAARLMGFELMENFKAPFFAHNVQNYWTRWHISLSSWIQDYLYFPLAIHPKLGKILGAGGVAFVTMTIMGFWHGAHWQYVAWGVYMGLLLVAYNRLRPFFFKHTRFQSAPAKNSFFVGSILLTFCLIILGEIFFRANDLSQAMRMFGGLLSNPGIGAKTAAHLSQGFILFGIVLLMDVGIFLKNDQAVLLRLPLLWRRSIQWGMGIAILAGLITNATELNRPFEYYKF